MALHGARGIEVRDIDLLLSRRDARIALERRGLPAAAGPPHPLFRSEIFGRWQEPPYTIELFAGFSVRRGDAWVEIVPTTRVDKSVGRASLFVPSVEELIAWGRLYGRDKDARREPLLRALLPDAGG